MLEKAHVRCIAGNLRLKPPFGEATSSFRLDSLRSVVSAGLSHWGLGGWLYVRVEELLLLHADSPWVHCGWSPIGSSRCAQCEEYLVLKVPPQPGKPT